jgi:hypothetical protein
VQLSSSTLPNPTTHQTQVKTDLHPSGITTSSSCATGQDEQQTDTIAAGLTLGPEPSVTRKHELASSQHAGPMYCPPLPQDAALGHGKRQEYLGLRSLADKMPDEPSVVAVALGGWSIDGAVD